MSVLADGKVRLKADANSAGFGGLATCGSVWLCPICSAKITARRASELTKILEWNAERGGTALMVTLTLRHRKGQRLRDLWHDGLRAAWRYMTQQPTWKKTRKLIGVDHYVRAVELTHGDNGWHVHIHCLMLASRPVSQDMADAFGGELFACWSRAVARQGHDTVYEAFDVQVASTGQHMERLGKYLAKLVYEAVGGQGKVGRKVGSMSPFQMLAEILETGRYDLVELWWEFERVSKGQRQLTFSRGLKAAAGVEDLTDEEIAEQELEGETLLTLDRDAWKVVYPVAAALLDATEARGIKGARAFLNALGVPFELGDTTVPYAMQRTMSSRRDRGCELSRSAIG